MQAGMSGYNPSILSAQQQQQQQLQQQHMQRQLMQQQAQQQQQGQQQRQAPVVSMYATGHGVQNMLQQQQSQALRQQASPSQGMLAGQASLGQESSYATYPQVAFLCVCRSAHNMVCMAGAVSLSNSNRQYHFLCYTFQTLGDTVAHDSHSTCMWHAKFHAKL